MTAIWTTRLGRGIVLAAMLAGVALVGTALLQFPRRGAVRAGISGIFCEQPVQDFGTLSLADATRQREHEFVITNGASHAVRIVKTTTTCGCTVASVTDAPIAPGGSAKVKVVVDWSQRAGGQGAAVTLHTDSSVVPTLMLWVRGALKVPAAVSPEEVNFGTLRPGESASRVISVSEATDPQPFQLSAVTNPSPHLTIRRVVSSGSAALEGPPGQFELTMTAPSAAGKEDTTVIFETTLNAQPRLTLKVHATFTGSITSVPASLFFTGAAGARGIESLSARVNFDAAGRKPVLELVGSLDSPFALKRHRELSAGALEVEVTFDRKQAKSALSRGVLRVTVGGEQLDVPLVALSGGRAS